MAEEKSSGRCVRLETSRSEKNPFLIPNKIKRKNKKTKNNDKKVHIIASIKFPPVSKTKKNGIGIRTTRGLNTNEMISAKNLLTF